MIPLPRIIYAKAKDGLLFRFLAKINPRFQVILEKSGKVQIPLKYPCMFP